MAEFEVCLVRRMVVGNEGGWGVHGLERAAILWQLLLERLSVVGKGWIRAATMYVLGAMLILSCLVGALL